MHGPFCEPCQRLCNQVFLESMRGLTLLYADQERYFERVREARRRGAAREYWGDVRPDPTVVMERPEASRSFPDIYLRRMERRVLLNVLAHLTVRQEDLEEPLRSATGCGLRELVGGPPPTRIYCGSPQVLVHSWARYGFTLLRDRFRELVAGGAVQRMADLPEIPMHQSAGGGVALFRVLDAEEHARLLAPPPSNSPLEQVSGVPGTRDSKESDGGTKTREPAVEERPASWLSGLSAPELLSLSAALGSEMEQRGLEDQVPRSRAKKDWHYEREALGRGWLQKDPRPSGGKTRGYWVFRWVEDGRIKHQYIGNDEALAFWKGRHPEGL